jgi:hypothetical protein
LAFRVSLFWSSSATPNKFISEHLLAMNYSKVAYATTHNSYAVVGKITASNHFKSIQESLEKGIRALMIDVHFSDDTKSKIALCHADCSMGTVRVDTTLDTIATFLDNHPVNVITIIWEVTCTGDEDCTSLKRMLYYTIEQSRLANMLYAPERRESPWPTLQKMVDQNEKIVQFFDRGPFERPWDLKMWDHVIENPYNNLNKNDLDEKCTFNRGGPDSPEKLFLNNHFTLMGLVPMPWTTIQYNTNPYMYNRMIRCQQELGKNTTNFISVDHWWYSDVIRTVACLNGEDTVQTCQTTDTDRTLFVAATSLVGIVLGIMYMYWAIRLYSMIPRQKPPVVDPTKTEEYSLLREVSMGSIDGGDV